MKKAASSSYLTLPGKQRNEGGGVTEPHSSWPLGLGDGLGERVKR